MGSNLSFQVRRMGNSLSFQKRRGMLDPNHIVFWHHPITGYGSPITFPRSDEFKMHMQQSYWEKMEYLIKEDMRKKRALEQVERYFTSPFIEDIAVPYLGFKRLNFTGVVKQIHNITMPKLMKLSDRDMWHLDPASYRTPVPEDYEVLEATFVSQWDQSHWEGGAIEAHCHEGGVTHDESYVPHPMCTCGIYAYNYDHWDRYQPIVHYGNVSEVANVIISLGGHVIPYTHGYRASIAKIEALVSDTGYWAVGEESQFSGIIPVQHTHDVNRGYEGGSLAVPVKQIATLLDVPIISSKTLPRFFKEYNERWQTP